MCGSSVDCLCGGGDHCSVSKTSFSWGLAAPKINWSPPNQKVTGLVWMLVNLLLPDFNILTLSLTNPAGSPPLEAYRFTTANMSSSILTQLHIGSFLLDGVSPPVRGFPVGWNKHAEQLHTLKCFWLLSKETLWQQEIVSSSETITGCFHRSSSKLLKLCKDNAHLPLYNNCTEQLGQHLLMV